MTQEYDNIALMRRFFQEVWNEGKEETIDELYAVGGESHGIGDEYEKGPGAFKQLHRVMLQTCDIHIQVDDIIAAGDRIAMRATIKMQHKATGKQLIVMGGGFARIQGGQIVEAWNGWDFLGALQQLGLLPQDALAQALQGSLKPIESK